MCCRACTAASRVCALATERSCDTGPRNRTAVINKLAKLTILERLCERLFRVAGIECNVIWDDPSFAMSLWLDVLSQSNAVEKPATASKKLSFAKDDRWKGARKYIGP